MQAAVPAIASTAAALCLAACNDDPPPDLATLATGERSVTDLGSRYELAFSVLLETCVATVTDAERSEDGTAFTRTVAVDLARIDPDRIEDGVAYSGSLGFIRVFAAEGAPEFNARSMRRGPVEPEALTDIRDAFATCTGDSTECGERYTTPHAQISVGGLNPFENVRIATEQLTTLAANCAATE